MMPSRSLSPPRIRNETKLMTDDDKDSWVAFSEVGINSRMRNALELFAERSKPHGPGSKELPAAVGAGGLISATGLVSEDASHDREELKHGTQSSSLPILKCAGALQREQG